ncbi:hypothetical protein BN1110_04038 [bacterium YEK0313]|nr:hypothetical protein BN1110_04038 [bacterium YEK0313]
MPGPDAAVHCRKVIGPMRPADPAGASAARWHQLPGPAAIVWRRKAKPSAVVVAMVSESTAPP